MPEYFRDIPVDTFVEAQKNPVSTWLKNRGPLEGALSHILEWSPAGDPQPLADELAYAWNERTSPREHEMLMGGINLIPGAAARRAHQAKTSLSGILKNIGALGGASVAAELAHPDDPAILRVDPEQTEHITPRRYHRKRGGPVRRFSYGGYAGPGDFNDYVWPSAQSLLGSAPSNGALQSIGRYGRNDDGGGSMGGLGDAEAGGVTGPGLAQASATPGEMGLGVLSAISNPAMAVMGTFASMALGVNPATPGWGAVMDAINTAINGPAFAGYNANDFGGYAGIEGESPGWDASMSGNDMGMADAYGLGPGNFGSPGWAGVADAYGLGPGNALATNSASMSMAGASGVGGVGGFGSSTGTASGVGLGAGNEGEAGPSGMGVSAGDTGGGTASCYITSAAVDHMGKKDDGPELKTLRDFRDNILSQSPEGLKLIAEYEHVAPHIVKEINGRPDAKKIYKKLYNQHIGPAVIAAKKGDTARTLALYGGMVKDLEKQYPDAVKKARGGAVYRPAKCRIH